MHIKPIHFALAVWFLGTSICHADFKYTQSSKVTGGSIVTMTKSLGVFSKNARQITDPQISTLMVKGNRLRSENANGMVQVIDIDGRRFIDIDPTRKTYSTTTFEEFKAAIQHAQQRANDGQAKAAGKGSQAANLQVTPKFSVLETGASKNILNLPAKEMKWRMDMEFQSTDSKLQQQAQAGSMTVNSDAWIAASVPGYDEMQKFYIRLAKELDWLPGTMGGLAGVNPQIGPAMQEFQKKAVSMKGMPLLQNLSMGMAATGSSQAQTASAQQPPASQQQAPTDPSSPSTSTRDAIYKGLGGMFSGFGKKKKPEQDAGCAPAADACDATPTGTTTNTPSLMDMEIQVTSYSSAALDGGLFEIPPGYTRVQKDPNQLFGGR